jgi:hypothetical protein
MKEKLLIIIAVLVLSILPATAQRQQYIKGAVTSLTQGAITVDSRALNLKGDCRVIIITQQDGSFYEHDGKVHDIRIGDTVYARVDYDTAVEIKIER